MSAQAGVPVGHVSRWVVIRPPNTPERVRAGPSLSASTGSSRADSRTRVCYPKHMSSSEPSVPVVPDDDEVRQDESTVTVVVAFVANVLIAVAKSLAAAVTGSASMLAEAAHSWADTGNEVFLLIAQRRAAKPADRTHPFGYGR